MKLKTLLAASLFATVLPLSHAGFIGVYDYLSSLTEPFPAQTGNEPWTFRNGDQSGALMGLYGSNGYGNVGAYAQFSGPATTGAGPGGSAGTNEAPGVFTHTASSGTTTAVYRADEAFTAQAFVIISELVNNGNQGNGIDLTLRTIINGVAVDRGTITIANTLSAQNVFDFGPGGLDFNAGDQVAVMFSARGSYLFDHGWWDIALTEVDRGGGGGTSHGVPDGGATAALVLAGIAGLQLIPRRI